MNSELPGGLSPDELGPEAFGRAEPVIAAYAPFCTAFECWTTSQLEDFVKALTGSRF